MSTINHNQLLETLLLILTFPAELFFYPTTLYALNLVFSDGTVLNNLVLFSFIKINNPETR